MLDDDHANCTIQVLYLSLSTVPSGKSSIPEARNRQLFYREHTTEMVCACTLQKKKNECN